MRFPIRAQPIVGPRTAYENKQCATPNTAENDAPTQIVIRHSLDAHPAEVPAIRFLLLAESVCPA
jgi:hypothetical protein